MRRRRGLLLALLDDVVNEAHQDQVRRGQLVADFLDAPAALADSESIDVAQKLLPAANLIARREEHDAGQRRRTASTRQVPPGTEHDFSTIMNYHLIDLRV